jgi:hypothetical protein
MEIECTDTGGKLVATFQRPVAGSGTAVSFEEDAPVSVL